MKSNMFWYTIFMSIQRLCYLGGGGGGPSLKPSQGNRENMGNKGTGTIFPPLEGFISSL